MQISETQLHITKRNGEVVEFDSNKIKIAISKAIRALKKEISEKDLDKIIEDIVNEINGLLAKVDNPQDLAEKMIQMVDNYDKYDPKAIRSDFEERFSSKVITPKIVEIYQQVIHEYSNQVSGRNE